MHDFGGTKKKKTLQKNKTNEKPIKLPDIVCDLGKSSETPISHNDIKAVYIVNPRLNQLIFSSRLEATENFGCWVFKNVHPSISKTGKGLKYCSKVSNELCFCSRHTCGLMKWLTQVESVYQSGRYTTLGWFKSNFSVFLLHFRFTSLFSFLVLCINDTPTSPITKTINVFSVENPTVLQRKIKIGQTALFPQYHATLQ